MAAQCGGATASGGAAVAAAQSFDECGNLVSMRALARHIQLASAAGPGWLASVLRPLGSVLASFLRVMKYMPVCSRYSYAQNVSSQVHDGREVVAPLRRKAALRGELLLGLRPRF